MFIVWVAVIAGALMLGYKLGREQGAEEVYSKQQGVIDSRFSEHGNFRLTYGVPGLYVSELNPKLSAAPLVIIQSSDFVNFVVKTNAAPNSTTDDIEKAKEQLINSYLLGQGMSAETIKTLESIFPRNGADEPDA
jgi:hypothetical protein